MKFILGFLLFYILFVVVLYVGQRGIIYFPDKTRPAAPQGVQVVSVSPEIGLDIQGWYIPPSSVDKGIILFFHGNAGHYGHRIHKAVHYIRAGYGVLLAGYRGYGGNGGNPSEHGFYSDGRAYMAWLNDIAPERDVIIYGESIGSGTATQMATEFDVSALILETPFSSLVDLASLRYFFVPVRYLLHDRYDNISKIRAIGVPLLVLHGEADSVIPISSAKDLYYAALEPKDFVNFPQGNHNDLYLFDAPEHILNFLSGIGLSNQP